VCGVCPASWREADGTSTTCLNFLLRGDATVYILTPKALLRQFDVWWE